MKTLDKTRWCFVDGMRGLAALGVLFSHLIRHNRHGGTISAILPLPLSFFCLHGESGVQVFFVISGFVIAHSLRDNTATGPELGNFILRRQLRLDPPYWAAMTFGLAVMFARNLYPGCVPLAFPTPGEILANTVYLQCILGSRQILGVAWTLCLEIQFYLFFVAILALGKALRGGRRSTDLEAAILLLTGCLSMLAARGVDQYAENVLPWFPYHWLYFAGGAICYLSFRDRRYDGSFALFLASLVLAFSWGDLWKANVVAGALTMIVFWVAGKTGRLTTWLRQSIFQYFGRISYSLYLIHLPITMNLLRFGYDASADNRLMALAWFFGAAAVSIVAAHFFHHWVEQPSMSLAASLKRTSSEHLASSSSVHLATTRLPLPVPPIVEIGPVARNLTGRT